MSCRPGSGRPGVRTDAGDQQRHVRVGRAGRAGLPRQPGDDLTGARAGVDQGDRADRRRIAEERVDALIAGHRAVRARGRQGGSGADGGHAAAGPGGQRAQPGVAAVGGGRGEPVGPVRDPARRHLRVAESADGSPAAGARGWSNPPRRSRRRTAGGRTRCRSAARRPGRAPERDPSAPAGWARSYRRRRPSRWRRRRAGPAREEGDDPEHGEDQRHSSEEGEPAESERAPAHLTELI